MKRFLTVLVLLCLVLALAPAVQTAAAPSVIFTAVNDVFIQNLTAELMPARVGGQMYIPYTTLSRLMTVSIYYNEKEQRVLVYNFDYTLTFDLANSITYDESGVVYSYNAIRRNGTVFVPVSLVCEKFGYYYSYITNAPLGPIVRINSEEVTVPDSVLVNKAQERMQQIYDAYIAASAPDPDQPDTPPDDPTVPDGGEEEPDPSSVYLAFEGELTGYTAGILDTLSERGQKAAFFISGGIKDHRDELRRIFAEGHTIGLYAPGQYASAEERLEALRALNAELSDVLHTRARLVWMPNSRDLTQQQRDVLIGAGYRLWEDNVDPRADVRSGYSVRVNVRNLVQKMQRSAVVRLLCNEASAEALPGVLSDLRQAGNDIQVVREWNTPVNGAREIR